MGDFRTLDLLRGIFWPYFCNGVNNGGVDNWNSTEQCTKLFYRNMTSIPTLRDVRRHVSDINNNNNKYEEKKEKLNLHSASTLRPKKN